MIVRWLRFNAVGIGGVLVQLAVLTAARQLLGLGALPATVLAVETAVLHNFYWHERWTWGTRGTPGLSVRLLRFHLANGLVSIASNLFWMQLLTGHFGVHYLAANGIAISLTAMLNFCLGERFVFRQPASSGSVTRLAISDRP